ncbi:MAG: GntR family transcriptional regulator [Anaerolineae bacterium]|nr:GntR family transcriptional regulator [Anaerolineae bacterium]
MKIRLPYIQVEEAIAAMIGQMQPGDQLPSEPTLAKQLGVSRATLREVLRTFAERGTLVRRQGIGTFVASRIPILETGLEMLESLDRMAKQLNLITEVTHLETVERKATLAEVAGLALPDNDVVGVLAVNRVITVEGQPVADLQDIVPLTYLRQADLDQIGMMRMKDITSFNGSVLDVLLQCGGLILSTSRTEIAAEEADMRCASRLNVKRGAALLKLVAQLYNYDEKVVDYSTSYFVPGYFRFHVMRKVINK